jgi:hypothetical protein
VSEDFYKDSTNECRTCKGEGVLWSKEETVHYVPYYVPSYPVYYPDAPTTPVDYPYITWCGTL